MAAVIERMHAHRGGHYRYSYLTVRRSGVGERRQKSRVCGSSRQTRRGGVDKRSSGGQRVVQRRYRRSCQASAAFAVAREALGYASTLNVYQNEHYDTMYDKYQVGLVAAQIGDDELARDALQRLLNLVAHRERHFRRLQPEAFHCSFALGYGTLRRERFLHGNLKEDSQACEFVGANLAHRLDPESAIV